MGRVLEKIARIPALAGERWETMNDAHLSSEAIAAEVDRSLAARVQIAPFSGRDASFDLFHGYAAAASLRGIREGRGAVSIGRKIGFTNTAAWKDLEISAPMWGDVYDTTVSFVNESDSETTLVLPPHPEMRIEPELVFGLAREPASGARDEDVLACVGWIAGGFEIVHSVFPGWRFRAADAVADGGLHTALVVGPRIERSALGSDFAARLRTLTVTLACDGEIVERGAATDVLGSPLTALATLIENLKLDARERPLRAGDVITSGTLTRARAIADGQRWRTAYAGLDVPSFTLKI